MFQFSADAKLTPPLREIGQPVEPGDSVRGRSARRTLPRPMKILLPCDWRREPTEATFAKLTPQEPVLFASVRDRLTLPTLEPPSEHARRSAPRRGRSRAGPYIMAGANGRPTCATVRAPRDRRHAKTRFAIINGRQCDHAGNVGSTRHECSGAPRTRDFANSANTTCR